MGDRRQPHKSPMQQKTSKTNSRHAHVRNVCVYCGSNPGANPAYAEAARKLGERSRATMSAWSTAAAASA